ncbi:PepSY domain-containing protein [Colwellia echini]|uniref:PepSY domain-containing protein n=1 Tax=Colwellia echini TaxID=1982103 RepID=A0ABY3MWH6_9GAMM|nr:PepSY domain-containing protein [Colwellia echini]TYK65545.1 PepSY domain-containing protein [Colwellia echini]
MILRAILLTLLLSVCALNAPNVMAAQSPVNISSQQAAKIVQSHFGGKILKVQRINNIYKVKIVKPNGQVTSKKVNASTGQIVAN